MPKITIEITSYIPHEDDEELYEEDVQHIIVDLGANDKTRICCGLDEWISLSEKGKGIAKKLQGVFPPGHLGMMPRVDVIEVDGTKPYQCSL